jgi:hypothetical protein
VGLVLEVLTDNFNRAAATIRDVVKKGGAKMADSGSVLFNFKRAGVIYVKVDSVKSDELLLAAMDAGAEDVLEPEADEDEDNDTEEEKYACFPACALSDGNGFPSICLQLMFHQGCWLLLGPCSIWSILFLD